MLTKAPTRRFRVSMTGRLVHAEAIISLGLHVLEDDSILNVEYRNRSIQLVHPSRTYQPIVVSTQWFDTVDWNQLFSVQLLEYPEAADDLGRLGDALNFLSMYEVGVSEMMTQLNIRQNLLPIGERKVLTDKPLEYLTNRTGRSVPAKWSAEAVSLTSWS